MAIELAGYRIHEEVYQSNNTIIYRGQRLRDAARVLIKVLKSNNPSPNRVARLRREFDIGRDMQAAGGIEYHALEPYNNGWALIMEDFPGVTLREAFSERKLNAPSFLETGIHICEQLTHIHQLGVIHKDIKPANILIDPRTGAVKFIDFGISSRLSRENPGVVHPGKLEGTLAYLAPEQTGRVNRSVDSRADLYSLGITFYELISGQLPFPGNDPMEIIHAHIAREVIPPEHFMDASPVPAAIQRILARLLAKSPEDRYQSAAGVRLDLEACAQFLQDGDSQSLMQFEPGRFDISDTLQIPQKLYGRENEIRRLLRSCADIQSGMARMLTVAGSSGVGKSSLIKEIHQVVARDGGFFLSGKFDQFRRDEPYNALIQAFQEVVRQILTESRESIQHWKERLVEALSRNGQLIIDVIPEVEHILGEQNAPPELSPTEAQNRFQLVFLNFIRVFAAPEHPLFLFLDDMQWADTATLNLLRNLLTDPESGHILIVGAYRDNEVNQVHPLALLFDDLNTSTSAVKEIKLQPLKIKDVYRLLADTLFFPECPEERIDSWVEEYIQARAPHADSKENPDAFGKAEQGMHRMEPPPGHELVEIIFKRTEGNPFFVAEYIKNLAHENLITFSPGERRWTWDLKNIRMRGVGDDVITMLTGQIQVLPSDTRRAICHASGLGGRFSLRMLALVLDQPAHTVADLLEPALQAGLITPRDDAYKYITRFSDQETTGRVQYTFIHDRVQHAAYDLLDDKTREQMHLRIGESLLAHLSHEEQDERIIIITNHLIKAR
ncbi:MAG: serine/threonine-protein kinase PknK, partial [Leptospiraceae bacterium]|nr:serine/threonine-protein kinase PknK [Leptospiraceae bacterium]